MRVWCILTLILALAGCGETSSDEAGSEELDISKSAPEADFEINTNELYELMGAHRQYIIDFFAYDSVTLVLWVKETSVALRPVQYRVVDPVVDYGIEDTVLPYNLKSQLFYKKKIQIKVGMKPIRWR